MAYSADVAEQVKAWPRGNAATDGGVRMGGCDVVKPGPIVGELAGMHEAVRGLEEQFALLESRLSSVVYARPRAESCPKPVDPVPSSSLMCCELMSIRCRMLALSGSLERLREDLEL